MNKFDFGNLNLDISSTFNSAQRVSEHFEEQQRILDNVSRETAKRNATIVAGSEANIAQKELLEQQLSTLGEQNKLLADNYNKLKELYDAQVQSNADAKEDLRRSRNFNAWMMVIAIIAMLAAIAGPIATILVSQ